MDINGLISKYGAEFEAYLRKIKGNDKQANPPKNAPQKKQDPELLLLVELFQTHPELTPHLKPSGGNNKTQLRKVAEQAFAYYDGLLQKRQAENKFINALHSNMVRDSGLLAIVNTLLQAAKQQQPEHWDLYSGYARQQLQQLLALEQAQAAVPNFPGTLSTKVLAEQLSHRLKALRADPLQTDYLPLYSCIKQLPLSEVPTDLAQWHKDAHCRLTNAMGQLKPQLQEALRLEFPNF